MLGSVHCFPQRGLHVAFILLVLWLALYSAAARPQSQVATVYGTVTDKSGAVIPSAQITILSRATGIRRIVLTDLTGQYHISGLSPGIYTVRAEKDQFQPEVVEEIFLSLGNAISINLSLGVGTVPQTVTVNADMAIDSTTATVSGAIAQRDLVTLPLNGRDLFKTAMLEPGVASTPSSSPSLLSSGKAGQVSVNGMRPSWTNLLIDGMDANEPVFGSSPAGASGLFLGLNGLAEVRFLTQTFDVEYGTNGGGVIEAVTNSGSNEFHGSLWEYHRDAFLSARNYFDQRSRPIPPFVRNQFGANIAGPLMHDQTFFFANYEGFREVQASTAIATVPNALAHQGLLPSATNRAVCSTTELDGCILIAVDPRVEQFLALLPLPNGVDHGDGTGDLSTDNKASTAEHLGLARVDHNFSNSHSLFARYMVDDSSSQVPSMGAPPGAYVPGFPAVHQARNQYLTVQDRRDLRQDVVNELRFGINRTTASTSIVDTHPGLSISLVHGRPFGTIDIDGMSLLGNSAAIPLRDLSTVYQIQDQVALGIHRHTIKTGVEYRRIQSSGPLDFGVNGVYTFRDLSPLGLQARTHNPGLEFFLQALPLAYVGVDPANSNTDRDYRQNVVSGFGQDFFRVTNHLSVNVGLRYDFYSNPSEAHRRLSVIRNPATDAGPTVGKLFAETPRDLFSPQAGIAWNILGDGKTILRAGAGIFRQQLPIIFFSAARELPPFFSISSYVFPDFLNPQNALLTAPIYVFQGTYHPKFPYALQYNINVEREVAPDTILTAGYFGARGNHLPREVEANPFEPGSGHRYNPNLPSPLLEDLTDGQSFYNSFQISVSERQAHNLFWQASYTLSHSIDDASSNVSIEAVNEPPSTQDPFNRKGDRGRSGFDIRHTFVAAASYEIPFRQKSQLGGWQVSTIVNVHSNVPFTPVLAFDNADLQSLLTSERPDLVGNPNTGACPGGVRVRTPSCWFNPGAFALPSPGQFGNAGRNMLRGPGFAELDLALQKHFRLWEGTRVTFGVEAYNLLNHPNFAVPSNTQSPLTLGGNGEAIFKDAAGNLASNTGRIFSTVSTSRQVQLDARFTF